MPSIPHGRHGPVRALTARPPTAFTLAIDRVTAAGHRYAPSWPASVVVIIGLLTSAPALADAAAQEPGTRVVEDQAHDAAAGNGGTLPVVTVTAPAMSTSGETLPPAYTGGQVARGARLGVLGNRDYMETPFNSIGYTNEALENQSAQTIGEAVLSDPSVRVSGNNGALSDEFRIRGFPVDNKDASLNGLYGVVPAYRSAIEYAERVEVTKGATGFLNGMAPTGSVGGTINVVTKRAGDTPLTRATATCSTQSQCGLHLDVGRRFGQDQALGIRANGLFRKGERAINDQDTQLGMGSLGLDWRGKRLRLSADLIAQQEKLDGIQHVFNVQPGFQVPAAPRGDTNFGQPWYHGDRKGRSYMASAEYDIGHRWTVYLRAGGANTTNDVLGVGGGFRMLNAQGDYATMDARVNYEYRTRAMDGGLRGEFDTGGVRHQVLLGINGYQQIAKRFMNIDRTPWISNIYQPTIRPAVDLASGTPSKEADIRLNSFIVADTLSFNDDRTQLTLGLRHQRVRTKSFNYATGAPRGEPYDESAVTPMVGLVYRLSPQLALYANYIEGLSQGETAPDGADNGGEIFAPYKSRQHEVGVKADWGRFGGSISLFQLKRPSGGYLPGTNVYAQGNQQRNRGLEINVFGEATRGLRLLGGAAFTSARLTQASTSEYQGKRAAGVPRVQLNLGGEWDVAALPGLTFSVLAAHSGKQYIDQANLQSIPASTRWDLGLRYRTRVGGHEATARLYVQNVANKAYWSAASIWGPGVYLGAPRTVNLAFSMDF